MKTLVAFLIIEDNDRKEQWQNCGALVYDLRTPNTRPKSGPPLIGTKFTDDRATVVLGSYGCVILNEVGMSMEMAGPGDMDRLMEICRGIVTENNADSDTGVDMVCQIYETFLYSKITDVSVMQPNALDHYGVMESDGLEHLRAVCEEMDGEDTVIIIRTMTPYNRGASPSS